MALAAQSSFRSWSRSTAFTLVHDLPSAVELRLPLADGHGRMSAGVTLRPAAPTEMGGATGAVQLQQPEAAGHLPPPMAALIRSGGASRASRSGSIRPPSKGRSCTTPWTDSRVPSDDAASAPRLRRFQEGSGGVWLLEFLRPRGRGVERTPLAHPRAGPVRHPNSPARARQPSDPFVPPTVSTRAPKTSVGQSRSAGQRHDPSRPVAPAPGPERGPVGASLAPADRSDRPCLPDADGQVTVADYKTGAAKEDHADQVSPLRGSLVARDRGSPRLGSRSSTSTTRRRRFWRAAISSVPKRRLLWRFARRSPCLRRNRRRRALLKAVGAVPSGRGATRDGNVRTFSDVRTAAQWTAN